LQKQCLPISWSGWRRNRGCVRNGNGDGIDTGAEVIEHFAIVAKLFEVGKFGANSCAFWARLLESTSQMPRCWRRRRRRPCCRYRLCRATDASDVDAIVRAEHVADERKVDRGAPTAAEVRLMIGAG